MVRTRRACLVLYAVCATLVASAQLANLGELFGPIDWEYFDPVDALRVSRTDATTSLLSCVMGCHSSEECRYIAFDNTTRSCHQTFFDQSAVSPLSLLGNSVTYFPLSFHFAHGCQWTRQYPDVDLNCPPNSVIVLIWAFWGRVRPKVEVCDTPKFDDSSDCTSSTIYDNVTRLCGGRQNCSISPTTGNLGNPCRNVVKYLQVVYECRKP